MHKTEYRKAKDHEHNCTRFLTVLAIVCMTIVLLAVNNLLQ